MPLSVFDEMEKAAFPEYWLRERCLFCCEGTEDAEEDTFLLCAVAGGSPKGRARC